METTARRASLVAEALSFVFDRLIIPIAVIVGLAGGAMIGTRLVEIGIPPIQTIH